MEQTNKKFRIRYVIAGILLFVIIFGLLGLTACNHDKGADKAIIYVTALFSGGLYNKDSHTAVWDPINAEIDVLDFYQGNVEIGELIDSISPELDSIVEILNKLFGVKKEGNLFYDLAVDMDGNLKNPSVIPANGYPVDANGNVMDISYGVLGIYKEFVENLKARYTDYDVLVYNQDWRLSSARSAEELEKFINSKGYKEVILMSHSMGSAVVNSYLARSEQNREKVKLYMGFAPATLGSFDALAALTSPETYIKSMFGSMLPIKVGPLTIDEAFLDRFIENLLSTENGDFVFNNQGLITLVPSWQYLNSAQYANREYGITVDGEPITSEEELFEFYESLSWAHYLEDYTDEYLNKCRRRVLADENEYADRDGYKLKDVVGTLKDYFASLFVDGKLACDSVNSYYFLGTECYTIVGMDLTSYYDDDGYIAYDYKLRYSPMGDGMVPLYSSIGGDSQDVSALDEEGRIIRFESKAHVTVGADFELLEPDIFRLIDSVVFPSA